MICDLEALIIDKVRKNEVKRKKLKAIMEESEGLLRAEVRLTEPKAIRG